MIRPARMLGVIALMAFAFILLTTLVDPDGLPLIAALPLLATSLITGVSETWGNYVYVDCRGIERTNWAGFTQQYIATHEIDGVYRQEERSWFGRDRPYIVIDSARDQIRLGIRFYRGGWPVEALARVAVKLAQCGAPVDEALMADADAAIS